jgi:Methyltransferase domain
VEGDRTKAIPRVTDFGAGFSLANLAEVMFPCLEAVAPKLVLEIGAYRGDLTRVLLAWAGETDARVAAVDPDPLDELLEFGRQHPELELILETSHEALRHISLPDAVIIDGDHNYYTLGEELRLIEKRAADGDLPLLMFHDVGWPHARRDTYCAPQRIPEEHRQPLAHDVALAPWEPGVAAGGLPFEWAAEREGGPRNGILTALEDFVGERQGLRLAIIPAFFGFGVLWHESAPWADAVASIVESWDRHPLLERLEAHRVTHLAVRLTQARELEEAHSHAADRIQVLREQAHRLREQEKLLRAMLGSRAFAIAERLSRLNQRGRPVFSRQEVRRALGDEDGSEPDTGATG